MNESCFPLQLMRCVTDIRKACECCRYCRQPPALKSSVQLDSKQTEEEFVQRAGEAPRMRFTADSRRYAVKCAFLFHQSVKNLFKGPGTLSRF